MEEKEFKIEIQEVLSCVVAVKANSLHEAKEKVEQMYLDEKIVLDYNNLKDTYFKPVQSSKKRHKTI